ncbi:hypothetical protein [Vibrio vulnificus]|nr:hypothetical protein [Vibrio vulnificus]MDS1804021.1 hypothetical protein [Vibrio vulnificus]
MTKSASLCRFVSVVALVLGSIQAKPVKRQLIRFKQVLLFSTKPR